MLRRQAVRFPVRPGRDRGGRKHSIQWTHAIVATTQPPGRPRRGPALRLYDTADRQMRPVTPGETATMYVRYHPV